LFAQGVIRLTVQRMNDEQVARSLCDLEMFYAEAIKIDWSARRIPPPSEDGHAEGLGGLGLA
jgi:hypothetical protein